VIAPQGGQVMNLIFGGKVAELLIDLADGLLLVWGQLEIELLESLGQFGALLWGHVLQPGPRVTGHIACPDR